MICQVMLSISFIYTEQISFATTWSRHLLKKYGNVPSVLEWEKNSKSIYDKRLLSELEPNRSLDGEFGFPLGVPAGVEDLNDFL